jgi:hypothetical protein
MQRPHAQGAGPVSLGSDAHPSTPKTPPQQRLDPIDVFAPWADDDEKALRRRIHRAQAAATTRASRSRHGRARQLYWWAATLAADWQFQRAPITDLSEILAGLARIFLTAGMIERLEAPDEQ